MTWCFSWWKAIKCTAASGLSSKAVEHILNQLQPRKMLYATATVVLQTPRRWYKWLILQKDSKSASLGDVSNDRDVNRHRSGIHDTMNLIGTLCKTLCLSTFRLLCEKLAKLHSPFQMAHQKVKTKLLPIPYYLNVVGIFEGINIRWKTTMVKLWHSGAKIASELEMFTF